MRFPCLLALVLALVPGCRTTLDDDPSRSVDLESLKASLPAAPVAVAFDVDDTLLFSSPGFYYANTNADGDDGGNVYGDEPLDNEAFWIDLDRRYDAFSLPKASARALVAMHAARGDAIWAITARPEVAEDRLTARLERAFDVELAGPVVFTSLGSKVAALRERGIVIFYGDSDGDIEDALAAGARPIRLLRSPMSTHPVAPDPGAFGEEVLVGSDR